MPILRMSAKTNLISATKAIVGMIHKHQHAEVQALGCLGVQHAERAIGRATILLAGEGIGIVSQATIVEPDVDGNEKPGMRFIIEPCGKPSSVSISCPEA